VGKFFGCFTSCDHSISEGSFCLDSMIHYAQAMGMVHIPYGTHMDHLGASQPVSGIVHLAGRENAIRPSQELGDALAVYADTLARYLV
jgi:NAD(P)H dehydrogenase (quinone)